MKHRNEKKKVRTSQSFSVRKLCVYMCVFINS